MRRRCVPLETWIPCRDRELPARHEGDGGSCRKNVILFVKTFPGNLLRPLGVLFDPAAAQDAVTIIANGGLAGSDGVTGFLEADAKLIAWQEFYGSVHRPAAVADFDLSLEGKGRGEKGEGRRMILRM